MRYVTPKQSQALSALALAALVSSCSLKSNGQPQTLTIALPGANFVQNPILRSMTEWMSLAWASTTTTTNLNNDPASLSEFDCFGVNVNGPGINLDPNITCADQADSPAIFGGFVPNGDASIDLMVPAGSDRTIRILGIKSLIGCPNFHDMVSNGGIDFKNIGHFYEIGRARQDIYADATVTIKATYSSATPTRAFSQCKANGDNSGSHLWTVYAGTGPGWVNASKTVNGTSYLTGKFDYIGPDTHSGVMISQASGAPAAYDIAHINGTVNCAAPDGFGGYFIGGKFTHIESTDFTQSAPYQANVLHILSNGNWDPNFVIKTDSVSGTINACVHDGNHLYVGGEFAGLYYNGSGYYNTTSLADISLNSAAVTDLSSSVAFGASPSVKALALGASHLYVGGSFIFQFTYHNAFSIVLSGTPTLDPTWRPEPDAPVRTLYYDGGSSVYLGGDFLIAGGQSRYHLARVNASSSGSVDSGWNPTGATVISSTTVTSVLSDGLFVYGAIASSGSPTVVRLDLATGAVEMPVFTANTGDSINTIALSSAAPPVLYIGGRFKSATGSPRQGVIAYGNLSTTPAPYSGFSANINSGHTVNTIVPDLAGRLFVGGDFNSIGGVLRDNMAAINLASGMPTSWNPTGFSRGEGTSIASDGSAYVYVGYKSDSTHSIVAGVAQLPLGGANVTYAHAAAANTYSDGDVNTIALSPDNTSLYVGGTFISMAGQSTLGGLARLHAADLSYDSGWTPTVSSPAIVNTIVANSNAVYVGGQFTMANSAPHYGLAAFNTGDSNIVSGWINNTALAQGSQAIAFLPSGDLAVATQTTSGSGPALIKKISGTTGANLQWATGQNNLSPSMTKAVTMIASNGALYVGGLASTSSESSLVAFDLMTDLPVSGFDPHFYNMFGSVNSGKTSVSSLEVPASGLLLVGGQFSQANVTNNSGNGGYEAWGLGVINANTGTYY